MSKSFKCIAGATEGNFSVFFRLSHDVESEVDGELQFEIISWIQKQAHMGRTSSADWSKFQKPRKAIKNIFF